MKERIPAKDIPAFIRSRYQLSPDIQKLVADNRRALEAQRKDFSEVARDINAGFLKMLSSSLNLDPQAFAALPHDVAEMLSATMLNWEVAKDIPGAEITVTFKSEVTVNGVRVPDDT